jgi:hypothetical protein
LRTRTWFLVTGVAAIVIAAYAQDLAAIYVAASTVAILYVLHAIEVKLNRLLDHYRIVVPDFEIAKD